MRGAPTTGASARSHPSWCVAPLSCALGLVMLLAFSSGCASIPEGRSVVDSVGVTGTHAFDESDITDKIATSASAKFLGLFRGVVYDYEVFDPHALQRDLARVERFYRARGFYSAHARAGRFTPTSARHVRVQIVVEEGAPILNRGLTVLGCEGLPEDLAKSVHKAATKKLKPGEPFDEDHFKAAEADARRVLTDNGYAYAKVTRDANLDVVHRVADAVLTVVPEQPAKFGKITFLGLDPDGDGPRVQEIPEGPLLRAISITEGDPYSTAVLEASTQALLDLEVFASVEIVADVPSTPPASHVVALKVKVEPTRLRAVRLGGGWEFDQIKTDLHGLIGWEDHNFAGDLRDFTVDLKPGVVLYPTRIDNLVAPDRLLPEGKLRIQLKQPGFIEGRTNGFIRPEFNFFPLLVKTNPAPDDPVVGYREFKGSVGVDRTLWKLYASLGYNAQIENPFSYKGDLDPALRTLVIMYPELVTQFDFRDDRIRPHSGFFLANTLQIAGGPFGGDARDVRVQPEVRTYLPLGKKVTFATRASVGFLLPSNYGDVVQNHLSEAVGDNRADRVKDIETVFFRGFFSGGSNSNRGYPIRGISPHGVVPFLNPATARQQVAINCAPSPANNYNPDASQCSIPIGGFTLWELSNELRFSVKGPFSAAAFCDMGDVSPRTANIRLNHMHLSCGLGARYETPVGPIRLDIGYRVQPLQVLGFSNEDDLSRSDPGEGVQPKIYGLPLALAFGIGEAF